VSLDPTSVSAKWQQIYITVYARCTNVTDDRQTDHAMDKCVGIGESYSPYKL